MYQHSFRVIRSRNPLARVLVGVIGLVVFALLLAIGVFALAAMVIGAGIFMLVRSLRSAAVPAASAGQPASPPPGVIEGEFTVVADSAAPTPQAHRPTPSAH